VRRRALLRRRHRAPGGPSPERADLAALAMQGIFGRALDLIALLDLEGRVVDVNPAVEQTLGRRRAALVGESWMRFVAPEAIDETGAHLTAKLDGSARTDRLQQTTLLGADGTRVPIEATSQVVSRDGNPAGLLVIGRDVSERLAARAALEESERLFRSAFEGVATGMTLTDANGILLRVNAAFARMVGRPSSELVGVSVSALIHPDDLPQLAGELDRLAAGLSLPRVVEKRFLRPDGEERLGHVSIAIVRNDDGAPLYVVGQVEDVTELRHIRAELDEVQTLHRLVFESSRDVLTVLNPDGTIRLVSPSVTDVLGYRPEDVIGHSFAEFVHPDDLKPVEVLVAAALQGETPPVIRSRYLAADGSYRLWEGTASPGHDGEGRLSYLIANSRDVTVQTELEDQLRHAQKLEAVGRLAGGVAHDFNNLLLVIRAYAELALAKNSERADCSHELDELLAAAGRASGLTSQLLAFSRRQVMHVEVLDLTAVIADMGDMLRRLTLESIELEIGLPPQPVLGRADRTQVEQMIVNLVVNASDAMPDGGLLTIAVDTDAAAHEARLIVRDTGTGMDTATAAQVFEPFFTTKGLDGTGLGLSMVHGIVTQSGGEIAVASRPGAGTTFTITLPLATADRPEAARVPLEVADGGSETILLVEDDPLVRGAVERMLASRGYRLLTAGSGEAAIELAQAQPGSVDLVLTDLVMPGINGREAAEAVRISQPRAKILYMSGYTDDVVIRANGFEQGVAFIQKPFGAEELALRIRELLDEPVDL